MHGYDDGYPMVAPVGSFAPNRFGLFDMAGNVRQWCQDRYRAGMVPPELLKEMPSLKNERSDQDEDFYVMRGSTWQSLGDELHSYWRSPSVQAYHPDTGGFRLVLVVNSQPRSQAVP
jgi:sulfatase modifying factor 1